MCRTKHVNTTNNGADDKHVQFFKNSSYNDNNHCHYYYNDTSKYFIVAVYDFVESTLCPKKRSQFYYFNNSVKC